jgi:hypothetical protein
MKKETKLKKQLATVEEWLARARLGIVDESFKLGRWTPIFSLLIALEQLVKYEKMKLEGE